eukprot:CAMPEP_0178441108 /NCGR_PEP_ID=MMETSP0689_2-20121128/37275_1 /TAXON_ID=160604 /ORGANISM="Amphidinium massartii, Strain CS-259" /LENGTH=125 /DNA_ID=CAMNT_0020064205 /DNA_START=1 /DNA_END=374 /DNA_ORIENTATION=+
MPFMARLSVNVGFADVVENTGSTARDHLANERTYLAWLRTGLSLLSFGLGAAKFWQSAWGITFAVFFVLLGIAVLIYAAVRYFNNSWALRNNKFLVSTGAAIYLSLGTGTVALLGVVYVLTALYR